MLYKLFENILNNKEMYITANDGRRFEDKIRNKLRTNFSEVKKEDIWNYENISVNEAKKEYSLLKEKILQKNSLEVVKNPFKKITNSFIFQPYGSQNFPDFLIFNERSVIPIEVKFSTNEKENNVKLTKNSKPMWNSNLPKANALYIYGIAGIDVTFFIGSDILNQDTRELLLGFWDRLTEGDLNEIFMQDMKKLKNHFGFYPYIRRAYDQKASAATYSYKTEEGNVKIGVESFFSENSKTRENNLLEFLKTLN